MKKIKPAWVPDDWSDEKYARVKEQLKPTTFSEIMDKWRVFWNETLESERERNMMRRLLSQEFKEKADTEEELEKINNLARALKGDLEK